MEVPPVQTGNFSPEDLSVYLITVCPAQPLPQYFLTIFSTGVFGLLSKASMYSFKFLSHSYDQKFIWGEKIKPLILLSPLKKNPTIPFGNKYRTYTKGILCSWFLLSVLRFRLLLQVSFVITYASSSLEPQLLHECPLRPCSLQ